MEELLGKAVTVSIPLRLVGETPLPESPDTTAAVAVAVVIAAPVLAQGVLVVVVQEENLQPHRHTPLLGRTEPAVAVVVVRKIRTGQAPMVGMALSLSGGRYEKILG
jgi:hypothetical protein